MPELMPGIHTIEGVLFDLAGARTSVHPVLIVEDGRLTLIDAGPAGAERPVREYIERLGFSLGDIERIIVTHHHFDHTGALARLASDTGAVVAAHADEVLFIEHRVAVPAPPLTPEGLRRVGIDWPASSYDAERRWEAGFTAPAAKVVEELAGGDTLPILGGLQVLRDTGHSAGHIALFAPARSVLFAADLFYYDGQNVQVPLPFFTEDEGPAVETLRSIVETCTFDVAIPYHGLPLIGNASRKLREALSAVPASAGQPAPGQVLPSG